MKPEVRSFKGEMRAVKGEDGYYTITGTAAPYNVLSRDLGGWFERILPGTFRRSLEGGNVKAFWNHNSDLVLGSRKAGSLVVEDSPNGLKFSIRTNAEWVGQYADMLARGDVDETSFGFLPDRRGTRWIIETNDKGEEVVICERSEAELLEISPVAIPAYPMTSVGLRDLFGTEDLNAIKAQLKEAAPEGDSETQARELEEIRIRSLGTIL